MAIGNEFDGINPSKYNIPGFIGREQLRLKYCQDSQIGKDAFNNLLLEIEPYIKEVLPHFKVKGKKTFTVREQQLIFHHLGPPPGYEI